MSEGLWTCPPDWLSPDLFVASLVISVRNRAGPLLPVLGFVTWSVGCVVICETFPVPKESAN